MNRIAGTLAIKLCATMDEFLVVAGEVRQWSDRHGWETITDDCATPRFHNLRIRAQLGRESVLKPYPADSKPALYAWSTEYHDVWDVGQYQAEAMLKTFRKLNSKLEKLDASFGRPTTFSQYVLRVANALGIETFVIPSSAEHYNRDSQEVSPREAAAWIDSQERDFIAKLTAKPESEVPA